MQTINVELKNIRPYANNPKQNGWAVNSVAQSIREFGFKVPMVLDKDYVIVCGHTRYEAATMLGLKEVPCVIADWMTEEEIRAYRLADNKVAEFSTRDWGALQEELNEIAAIDMESFGFQNIENNDLMPQAIAEAEEASDAPGVKERACPRCGRKFEV